MFLRIKDKSAGLTLVELLVSFALSGLIISMIAGMFIFVNKNFIGFQDRSNFNDQRLLLESNIRRHLRKIDKITVADDDEIGYKTFKEFINTIKKSGLNKILINDEDVLPNGFEITNFAFRYLQILRENDESNTEEVRDLNGNFILDGEELKSIDLIKLEFGLKYKEIIRTIEITHFIRSKY